MRRELAGAKGPTASKSRRRRRGASRAGRKVKAWVVCAPRRCVLGVRATRAGRGAPRWFPFQQGDDGRKGGGAPSPKTAPPARGAPSASHTGAAASALFPLRGAPDEHLAVGAPASRSWASVWCAGIFQERIDTYNSKCRDGRPPCARPGAPWPLRALIIRTLGERKGCAHLYGVAQTQASSTTLTLGAKTL